MIVNEELIYVKSISKNQKTKYNISMIGSP